MQPQLTRRQCLKSAAAVSAFWILPSGLAHSYAANEKVNIGIIGAGGRGGANLKGVSGENIVALCDVDRNRLGAAARRHEKAHTYTDYRELLDKEKTLDAVVVSTPDHMHAPISVRAMRQGLHCYCEKPLTHAVAEARLMTQIAAEKKLSTHMGTASRGHEQTVRAVEVIRSGALGQVTEAHFWTNRPIWPQGFSRPPGNDPIPESLDWNSWVGSAPMRPYKERWPQGHPVYKLPPNQRRGGLVYHPFVWRGWWDFGTGALGDIAPHMWSPVYWGLELRAPVSVEIVEVSGPTQEMFPAASILQFQFNTQDGRSVKIFWYDGGKKPSADLVGLKNVPDGGYLIVGTKATIGTGQKSTGDFPDVPKTLRRYGDMYSEWIAGIKQGDPDRPSCPFSYAGPLTEAYLLGNIALKVGQRIEWDAEGMRVTNCPEANQYVRREYRKGWEV
ncbi:MAG TPA: Gfo/Idh/MocA family oxidoreductase [Planctomycetaceae bacterium]|nr:Gfo/Idh/MocA family oxidoreductase [Planctomycetaceae bacterium]